VCWCTGTTPASSRTNWRGRMPSRSCSLPVSLRRIPPGVGMCQPPFSLEVPWLPFPVS
jgi:hypothetical protein